MALSEKLYTLRKKSGLSQEQLAERLNVSRQAVSKWESGASVPETEKLRAIGAFFGVSLDYLLGQESQPPQPEKPSGPILDRRGLAGLLICAAGILGLLLWGLATCLSPGVSQRLSESSAITIDGSGLLLIACAAAIAAGAALLLRGAGKK